MNTPWSRWLKRMKSAQAKAAQKRRRVVLNLEHLEERAVPTTVTVNTPTDANALNATLSPNIDGMGHISLRSAIEFLNANPNTNDTIIVPAGHYLLTAAGGAGQGTAGSLDVTDANGVAIQGAGAASTLIDAQQLDRVMHTHTGFGTTNSLKGLTIENGLVPIRFGDASGGGILDDSGALTITDCVLTNNKAQGSGGGAGYGGAIFEDTGSDLLTIIDTTISNNKAIGSPGEGVGGGFGGGVFVNFSALAIQSSTFSGNQALGANGFNGGNGEGGGLCVVSDDQPYLVSNSTFSGNSATGGAGGANGSGGNGFGGAIFSFGAFRSGNPLNTITNTTIANNQANGGVPQRGNGLGEGGGIYNDYGGEVSVGSTIVAQNTATDGGGTPGIGTPGEGQDVFDTMNNSTQVITSLDFNLIGDDDQPTGDFTGTHDQVGSSGSPIDPLLGPLALNGAPPGTPFTLALPPNSKAIDQGSNTFGDVNGNPLAFDERDPARTVNLPPPNAGDGTDVGAFELQATPTINTTQQPASATVGGPIADQATVSGGDNPTGTVTFKLYNNSTASGAPLFTDIETLSGGTATSTVYTAAAVGTDYWVATYSGDSHNFSVTSGASDEPVVIRKAQPTINTTQQPASATVGGPIADQATVSGGDNPTGTVTFKLYNNSTASGAPLFTDIETLSGGTATSTVYTAAAAGTDFWVATFNGDSNNAVATSAAAAEPVVISSPPPPPVPSNPGFPGTFVIPPINVPNADPNFASKVQLLGSDNGSGQLSADVLFVNGLYHQLLGRAPDVEGLNGWVFLLESGVSRLTVTDAIWRSPEHRGVEVDQDYLTFLHRAAAADERVGWVNAFLAGASETAVAEQFLLSPEYQNAHPDNASFVAGLYSDVLGHPTDPVGAAGWVQALQSGASRASVALAFLTSAEADAAIVGMFYTSFLHRTAGQDEVQGWVAALQTGGLSPMQVGEIFLASDEFFAHPL